MKEFRVASRYAKSLLGLAVEQNTLEEAFADMKLVADTCAESREFRLLLLSPIVKSDKKQKIIDIVFANQLGAISKNFIEIIVRKKREYMLGEIANEFVGQYKTHKHIVTAKVTTAIELDSDLKKRILELVAKQETGDIELEETVDSDIIGGFIVRVGDKQIDASVAGKFSELKQEFNKNEYVPEF